MLDAAPSRIGTAEIAYTHTQSQTHNLIMSQYEGALLGMGNPLLDIINDVDQSFLDKYDVNDRWCRRNVFAFPEFIQ